MEETALAVEALATLLLSDEWNQRPLTVETAENAVSASTVSLPPRGLTQSLQSQSLTTSRNPDDDRSVESGSTATTHDACFSDGNSGEAAGAALENAVNHANTGGGKERSQQAIIRGIDFLLRAIDRNQHRLPWPIGFYFAKLWYHERLYPLIFSTSALAKYLQWVEQKPVAADPPEMTRVET